ncbi:hypothetical protein AS200_16895 [Streptomyces sp. CdTB01]|nr:hypothetical protein AS200_16895 [Streptomyces sp. CdTB01]
MLLVLLAALLHILDCAHGPMAGPSGRADALLLTSSVSCEQGPEASQRTTDRQTAPAQDSRVHCWGLDEPTLQPPRDVALTVPTVHGAPPSEHLGAQPPLALPALRGSPPTPGAPSPEQTRARLGVWRT